MAMERTTFQIDVRPAPPSASGKDAIEFLVSPNLGESPSPSKKLLPVARSRALRWL
jgi:DNA repair ATPase RecN